MTNTFNPQEEWEIIQQSIDDRQNFRPLYKAYIEKLYAYVAYRVNNQQDAEDIVSQVFIKTLDNLSQYDNKYPFASWIFGIARNTIIDYYRHHDHAPNTIPFDKVYTLSNTSQTPEASLMEQQRSQKIRDYIQQLSKRRQEVITLRFYGGLKNKTIAHLLDLDERTIASHISRALQDLQSILEEEINHDSVI